MYYIYLLRLSNNRYYVEQTKNVELRVKKHMRGEVLSTSRVRSVQLVWYSAFESREKAVGFEKYLKTASGKAFRNKRLV